MCARYRHISEVCLPRWGIALGSHDGNSGSVYGKNLVKLLRAIDLLSRSEGASIRELQDGLGVSRRSVYRLFDVLESLHFPLMDLDRAGEKEKRWSLEEGFVHRMPNLRVPHMKLTPQELLVLTFQLRKDQVLAGTSVGNLVKSIHQKIAAIIPPEYLAVTESERLESLFVADELHGVRYRGMEETIESLFEALFERRICTVSYKALSDGKTKTYTIHPLRLFQHDGALFVFVAIPEKNVVRILAVERIVELVLCDERFSEPERFDPGDILGHTFNLTLDDPVTVIIRFSPEAARRIRGRQWSATQSIEEHTDGSIVLSMKTSGRDDVISWILSFGAQAEVLEPPELRNGVVEKARTIISKYQ